MTLGDIISQYRREHAMSMDKFSKMSGISKAYISMLEKNRTQRGEEPAPSIEMYRNVANAIGVDVDELVRMVDGKVLLSKNLPSNCLPVPRTVKKPRLGAIACGKPILAVENISEYDEVPADIHCDFTLLCKGDSMIDARILDGDATLKKVYYNGRRIILRACNPLYADMEYEGEELNDVEILGKAVAFSSMI